MSWKWDGRYFSTQGIEDGGGGGVVSKAFEVVFLGKWDDDMNGRWDDGDTLRFLPRIFFE
jgi:hypothetical protein